MGRCVTKNGQQGFALILAILALMLLTFLGLTLAATTSTELQIATNFRWSQQAYYNAEAGIEAAKIVLRGVQPNWAGILPARRTAWANNVNAPKCGPTGTSGNNCTPVSAAVRNWEGVDCDGRNGVGYGAVLTTGGTSYENIQTFQNRVVAGAFTVWVKRDVVISGASNLIDEDSNNTLVLTSEGVAPLPMNAAGSAQLQAARAVRVLQVKLNYGPAAQGCTAAEGQAGTMASGANFGACAPLDNGSLNQALGGGGGSRADTGVQ